MNEGQERTEGYVLLYEREFDSMAREAQFLLKVNELPQSAVDAEDVVQEAFMKVLLHQEVRAPRAYLKRIIKNEVSRRSRTFEPTVQLLEERLPSQDTYELASRTTPSDSDLHVALGELSERQRVAVWVTKALGHTRNEAAALLRCAPGTVARHTSRGTAALKRAFGITILVVLMIWVSLKFPPFTGSEPPGCVNTPVCKMCW